MMCNSLTRSIRLISACLYRSVQLALSEICSKALQLRTVSRTVQGEHSQELLCSIWQLRATCLHTDARHYQHVEVQEAAAEVESFMGTSALLRRDFGFQVLKVSWQGWSARLDLSVLPPRQGMDVYVTQILAELYYLIDEEGGIPSPKRAAALLGSAACIATMSSSSSLPSEMCFHAGGKVCVKRRC